MCWRRRKGISRTAGFGTDFDAPSSLQTRMWPGPKLAREILVRSREYRESSTRARAIGFLRAAARAGSRPARAEWRVSSPDQRATDRRWSHTRIYRPEPTGLDTATGRFVAAHLRQPE